MPYLMSDNVLVVNGDTPLITPETLLKFIDIFKTMKSIWRFFLFILKESILMEEFLEIIREM